MESERTENGVLIDKIRLLGAGLVDAGGSGMYHEKLREGVLAARKRFRQGDIAKAVGIAPQTLSGFMSGAVLSARVAHELELWLVKHGYFATEDSRTHTPDPAQGIEDPIDAIALQMQRLAPLLFTRSGLSYEERAAILREGMLTLNEYLVPRVDGGTPPKSGPNRP